MTQNTFFSYKIQEDDGDLVVTIGGTVAGSLIEQIRSGQDQTMLNKLIPFLGMTSLPVQIAGTKTELEQVSDSSTGLDMAEIFGQGFDRNFDTFESQLSEFRVLLSEDLKHDEIKTDDPKKNPTDKKTQLTK